MQLTPRNLVMACGALLTGGAVFGVVTSLAPAISLPTATAAAATPAAGTGEVGDEEISFPASADPTVSPWPTPVAANPAPTTPSMTSTPTPAVRSSTPRATTNPSRPASSTPRPRATARTGSTPEARATRAPRPTATPTRARRTSPTPAPAPSPRRTGVTGGWQAPTLHVGENTITLPRLTSRATAHVTVGCSPSSACHISDNQLVIDPAATAVTVTWWAPAITGYRAWQVSRVL